MHYYQHHIGDFIKDTSYLSNEEVGVYMKLIWIYYDTEQPLPNDINELALKTNSRSCLTVVEQMLKIFFVLTEDGWRHARCDREIAEYRSFIDKKSRAGKASAERRLSNSMTRVEQVLNNSDTVEQLTTNHKPLTNKYSDDFESFWKAYPSKVAKTEAYKSWKKIKPDVVLFEKIIDGLKSYNRSKKVQDGFIANPSTWLNQRRWEDESNPQSHKSNQFAGAI